MDLKIAVLAALAALSACAEPKPSATEQAAQDARDIAMVEAAQQTKPPPVAIVPEPMNAVEVARYGASTSCAFVPAEATGSAPILLAGEDRAWLKIGERVHGHASDSGSRRIGGAAFTKYDGKERSLTIVQKAGDGVSPGDDRMRWNATLSVRDAWGQLIYTANGDFACGA